MNIQGRHPSGPPFKMEPKVEELINAMIAFCEQPLPEEDPATTSPVETMVPTGTALDLPEPPKGAMPLPATTPVTTVLFPAPAIYFPPAPKPGNISLDEAADHTQYQQFYTELKTLFGTGFCGIDEVTRAFTTQNGVLPGNTMASFHERLHGATLKALWDNCQKPDIAAFLSKIKAGEVNASDWLLILRIPFLKKPNEEKEIPLTMKALQEHIAPDMLKCEQGKLLYEVSWYPQEVFYATQAISSFHWQFVTKACTPGTKGVNHDAQATALNAYAQKVGLDPALTRRRIPVEVPYDHLVTLRAHNMRLLVNEYDWTDTRASDGGCVFVGDGDAYGLGVFRRSADVSDGDRGACLSR